MKISIQGKNLEITNGLRQYAEKRLSTLDRYSRNIIDSELVLEEEKGRVKGEMIVKVKGSTLKVSSVGKDAFNAIDELKDKIKSQLKKYEEKLKDRRV